MYPRTSNETKTKFQIQLFNDAPTNQDQWSFSSVPLPESNDDDRVHVVNRRPDGARFGIDNVRFSTDERCSPR